MSSGVAHNSRYCESADYLLVASGFTPFEEIRYRGNEGFSEVNNTDMFATVPNFPHRKIGYSHHSNQSQTYIKTVFHYFRCGLKS